MTELDIEHLPGADGAIDLGLQRELPGALPVLPLRETVAFPDTLTPLAVGQERSVSLINDVLAGNRMLVMLASKDPELEAPGPEQLIHLPPHALEVREQIALGCHRSQLSRPGRAQTV